MKFHISSKLTQYLTDEIPDQKLFKTFTAMPKWNLKKRVKQQRYPIQLYGSPLDCMYTLEVRGIP